MDLGIFIPIANNGWMMSVNSPQYMPSFQLNRTIAEKAEAYGFNFLLSMVKLRGFGGQTEFWDHNLESFTLMAGLAAVTERIQLFASVATPTLPPALVARMADHRRHLQRTVRDQHRVRVEPVGVCADGPVAG